MIGACAGDALQGAPPPHPRLRAPKPVPPGPLRQSAWGAYECGAANVVRATTDVVDTGMITSIFLESHLLQGVWGAALPPSGEREGRSHLAEMSQELSL